MGARSETLARQFEAKAREAAAVLEKLSDADWKKVTEAEGWTVGVTAPPGGRPRAGGRHRGGDRVRAVTG
jgi:hypothetical protein